MGLVGTLFGTQIMMLIGMLIGIFAGAVVVVGVDADWGRGGDGVVVVRAVQGPVEKCEGRMPARSN